MKEKYLEELKERLGQYDTSEDEINDILADYEEMIDEAKERGMSDDDIIEMIGTPKKVARNLSDSFAIRFNRTKEAIKKNSKKKDNRIVALMPFISVITFMVLGLGFGLWHPGWMVFLSIPVVAIIVNAFDRKGDGLVSLSPFIAVVTYLILGFVGGWWHPGWLVFFIIPVFGILTGAKKMKLTELLVSLSPFIAVTFFVLWTYNFGDYEYAWLAFLLIPLLGGLNFKQTYKKITFSVVLLISVGAYVYLLSQTEVGFYALFVFLIPIGTSILLSDDKHFIISCDVSKKDLPMLLVVLSVVAAYIALGLLFPTTWAYMWMLFLLIPMFAIVRYGSKKDRLVALMPFIATIIFFTVGFFLQGWAYSWIAFLLIPMVAIIKNA